MIQVHVNGETISATPSHPFYVYKFGWTLAGSLKAGDVLVLSNGELVTVEWVQHEILESPIKVYNFEVEDFHTYFVGKSSVLVHNDCPEWLREKWEEGNNFNKENRPRYQYNEVEVQGTNKNYRVDSYNPNEAIVSRKYTQLSEVKEKTAIGYINELNYKYPSGAVITDSSFNPAAIRGQPMVGSLYLEVPVQNNPVPQSIIDFANSKGITIIDIKGTVYT